MPRLLLAIVALLFLFAGFHPEVGTHAVSAEATAGSDCCPDEDQEGDCCDWDFGACCAMGFAATVPEAAPGPEVDTPGLAREGRVALAPHLLRPRGNGPPPTPPPIG